MRKKVCDVSLERLWESSATPNMRRTRGTSLLSLVQFKIRNRLFQNTYVKVTYTNISNTDISSTHRVYILDIKGAPWNK